MATVINDAQGLAALREQIKSQRATNIPQITVCGGTGCTASGCKDVVAAFKQGIEERGWSGKLALKTTGCHGFCEQGPLAIFEPQGLFYCHIKTKDVPDILDKTLAQGEVIEKLLYVDPATQQPKRLAKDVPFYAHQTRLVLDFNQKIDPFSIDDYIAEGGYVALTKALGMEPGAIIDEVEKAGLRGRGGGGFLTARKWKSSAKAPTPDGMRYLLCNADEGDPGAFMDRSILEGNPHRVLEGMIIAAYAIGAPEGYIYVRLEYPLAVETFTKACQDARAHGLLGENILGTGFNFDIKINLGGGAFVCGESTALMASIEGLPGEPRPKHIHTAVSGLFQRPTVLNNVETFANVPFIIERGADWYRTLGTEKSKGTKIFALVGKINNTGLVEVPMGMTLRQIIEDIGGGIRGGRPFKAVQTGGPSGGCLPASMLDVPVDFDELTKHGSMMGSGGMIVMDDTTCMVDVARYFTAFLEDESCGKCTACREGLHRSRQILDRICEGKGRPGDIELLEELAVALEHGSLCALGQSAAYPIQSTLKYFRDEYEAHINEKRCPAGVCKELIQFKINPDLCDGCHLCAKRCPVSCIAGQPKELHVIDSNPCVRCGVCKDACPTNAIDIVPAHAIQV